MARDRRYTVESPSMRVAFSMERRKGLVGINGIQMNTMKVTSKTIKFMEMGDM